MDELVLSIKKKNNVNGKRSTTYDISLGDWKLGKGVTSINLDMPGNGSPKLVIECYPDKIDIDGVEVVARLNDPRRHSVTIPQPTYALSESEIEHAKQQVKGRRSNES